LVKIVRSRDIPWVDRHTHTHTHTLITILCSRSHGRSKYKLCKRLESTARKKLCHVSIVWVMSLESDYLQNSQVYRGNKLQFWYYTSNKLPTDAEEIARSLSQYNSW